MVQSQCRSTNRNPSRAGWRSVALALAATLLAPAVARADTATISVVSDQYLRFGSFVVPSAGARTVSASGAVTTSGLLPVGNDPIGPAQFTVAYDRGFDSTRQIAIQVQVVLPRAQAMALAPVTLLAALLVAMPARANGLVADANGESRAEIVAPLTVTRDTDLDFGSIFATTQWR